MDKLLRGLASLISTRPRRLLSSLVIPSILLGLFVFRVPLDLTFVGILDRSHPEVERYFAQGEELGLGGTLIVLLEASPPESGDVAHPIQPADSLERAVSRLRIALEDDPAVAVIIDDPPTDWLLQQAIWILPAQDFDDLIDALRSQLEIEGSAGVAAFLSGTDQQQNGLAPLLSRLSATLAVKRDPNTIQKVVQVRLWHDPLTQPFGDATTSRLAPLIEKALDGSGVTHQLSGLPAVAAQDQQRTLGIVRRLSPLSLLAVVGLLLLVERRPLILLAVLSALLLSVAATLGVIGLTTGRLTLMETFFGVTVFGLGIDFALHLLLRLRYELQSSTDVDHVLATALVGTGRGIIAGGLTTAGAFLVIATAPDPLARHLGLSGGLGLIFCLILMLTLVPLAWRRTVLEPRVQSDQNSKDRPRADGSLIERFAQHAVDHPRLHLTMAAVAVLLAVSGLPRFELESRIERVFNRKVPAVATVNEIRERFGINGAPWILEATTLEEASSMAAELRASPAFASVSSPSDVLPTDAAEVERRRRLLEPLHQSLHQRLSMAERMVAPSFRPPPDSELGLLWRFARALDLAIEHGPSDAASLPVSLLVQFRGTKALASPPLAGETRGPWLLYAYGKESTFDAKSARSARLAAQEVSEQATGTGAILEAVLLGPRPWLVPVALGVVLFVGLVLWIDLRRPRWVLLAVLPVAIGTLVTLGLLCWLPMDFNVMTLVVLPLLIGLGVDDGLHVVHRIREGRESIARATGAVGTAIVMTTATTCASFFVLLFTDHPGLESMAFVMLLGLPLCLLASVSSLPAAATLLRMRPRGHDLAD